VFIQKLIGNFKYYQPLALSVFKHARSKTNYLGVGEKKLNLAL